MSTRQRSLGIPARGKTCTKCQRARNTGKYAWVTKVTMLAIVVVWTSSQCAADIGVRFISGRNAQAPFTGHARIRAAHTLLSLFYLVLFVSFVV